MEEESTNKVQSEQDNLIQLLQKLVEEKDNKILKLEEHITVLERKKTHVR